MADTDNLRDLQRRVYGPDRNPLAAAELRKLLAQLNNSSQQPASAVAQQPNPRHRLRLPMALTVVSCLVLVGSGAAIFGSALKQALPACPTTWICSRSGNEVLAKPGLGKPATADLPPGANVTVDAKTGRPVNASWPLNLHSALVLQTNQHR